jgi:hypothetical protein
MKYLNENIHPEYYNLDFNLDLLNDKFNGINNIILNCINPTNIIQFHAHTIILDEIILDNMIIPINSLKYDNENSKY